MSPKSLKMVITGVCALMALYAFTTTFSSRAPSLEASDSAIADAFASVGADELEAVRFNSGGDTIEIRRAEDGWTADGYPADTARVRALREAVGSVSVARLAASNPDNHARLGVTDDSASVLELQPADGDPVRVLLGSSGGSTSTVYARLPGADDVYLLRSELGGMARRVPEDWRDLNIVRVDTASAARIEVERDGESYVLERADSAWTVDGGAADAEVVRDMLRELASLSASGFAPLSTEVTASDRTVAVFGSEGDTLARLTLTEDPDVGWIVRVPDRNALYKLPEFTIGRLAPSRVEVAGGS